ncbi:GGDEF domain-containing protein [Paenibacillus sp. GSMTC-2017]|uniref:diguanylate cyclase domain-containing protein n=1 Tax=Paenibacillus sp. GSMTC-2017 TaxID=2794350 RepID=UPI0018D7457E|nr:diguanylate cyclase [Paenibacillus sp. GSMTC-2017]MBH5317527.1 GGDEF domain-containing protein [Paenibacillus sp. GSMTC-2017]
MNRNRSGIQSDLGFLLFIVLSFVGVVYISGDPDHYVQNLILLNVVFLIAILTYFTTITMGLLLNILFIFAYGTYTIYETVVVGAGVHIGTYFWLLMAPLYTSAIYLFARGVLNIQSENEELRNSTKQFAMMDQNTNLKNILSFQKDATIFMALSDRYEIPLTLLVMEVRYWKEVRNMISDDRMSDVLYELSQMSQTSIRSNDSLYMLDQENATWGLLLFTDVDGAKNVVNRIKEAVQEFNHKDKQKGFQVEFQLRMGGFQYNEETVRSPLDFIDKARKQLEYDV